MGIGAFRFPAVRVAAVRRCPHVQVYGGLLSRAQLEIRRVPCGFLCVHGDGRHILGLRHVPHTLPDLAFRHRLPDRLVRQVIIAVPSFESGVINARVRGIHRTLPAECQALHRAVIQLRRTALGNQFAQVHGSKFSLPLAFVVPFTGPVFLRGQAGFIVGNILLNGVIEEDARGSAVMLGGYGQAVGIFAALRHSDLGFVLGTLSPVAVCIRAGVLPELHMIRNVDVSQVQAAPGIYEALLIGIRIQVRHQASHGFGNGGRKGAGSLRRPFIRISRCLGIHRVRFQVPQLSGIAGLESHIVIQVSFLVLCQVAVIRPVEVQVHVQAERVRSPAGIVVRRIRRHFGFDFHQGPAAVPVVFENFHAGNPV